ncbi:VOC family protein [Actinomadura chibensis]|uniref:Glyoxalase n=1 Tax=Actinomadura chibensis TaxID=392828 RepID=A0A5D0N983_9ACTN|nr:VOC family protein [Actinomadura chibensis]TYB41054.1 glyoxalase [Actinomadura chibensis]
MSEVKALGYLGFHAPDVAAWRTWATGLLGMQVAEPPPGTPAGALFLRMDERGWRLAVEPGESGRLAYTGWEVADPAALERLGNHLADADVKVVEDPALARRRRVERLIRCADPDGNELEFFCGAFIPEQPFVSPLGTGFVTGDLGLGHILQNVANADAARRFYLDVLGFRLSDVIEFGPNRVHFLRVNRRHHSLAFVEVAEKPPSLGHFMVEVDDLDTVGRALDRVNAGMARLTETLGKHTNDHMVSFYMMNPSGSQTEYGCAGRLVDEATWKTNVYSATAYWGHKVPGSEYSTGGPVSPRTGD